MKITIDIDKIADSIETDRADISEIVAQIAESLRGVDGPSEGRADTLRETKKILRQIAASLAVIADTMAGG